MSLDPETGLPEKKPTKLLLDWSNVKIGNNKGAEISNINIPELQRLGVQSYNPLSNNTQLQLAEHQTRLEQTGYGLARLTNIVPEIIGNFGAIADIEDYYNQDAEVGNWLSNAMQEWKDATKESLPIYRENPSKPLDLGDFAYWAENGSDLVTSIGGFAATGALTGGPLSLLSKFGKMGQYTGTVMNAVALNQAESIMEAVPVYDSNYKAAILKGLNSKEATEIAAEAAAATVNINRWNILLNISSASMFIKNAKGSNQFLEQLTKKKTVTRSIAEMGQEGSEELVNLKAQKEGDRKGAALMDGKDYTASLFNNFMGDVMTMEGLEVFALGAVGGGGQTFISAGIGNLDNKFYTGKYAEHRKNYASQQERIKELKSLIDLPNDHSEVFMETGAIIDLMDKIHNEKDPGTKAKLEDLLLSEQVFNQVSKEQGVETLNAIYNSFLEMSPEQAKEKGLPENYKEKAKKALKDINRLNKHAEIANSFKKSKQIFNELVYRDQLINDKESLNEEVKQAEDKLSKITDTILDGAYTFEELSNSEEFNKVKDLPEYTDVLKLKEKIALTNDNLSIVLSNFSNLISSEVQEESVKETKKDVVKAKAEATEAVANPKEGNNPFDMLGALDTTEDGRIIEQQEDDAETEAESDGMTDARRSILGEMSPSQSDEDLGTNEETETNKETEPIILSKEESKKKRKKEEEKIAADSKEKLKTLNDNLTQKEKELKEANELLEELEQDSSTDNKINTTEEKRQKAEKIVEKLGTNTTEAVKEVLEDEVTDDEVEEAAEENDTVEETKVKIVEKVKEKLKDPQVEVTGTNGFKALVNRIFQAIKKAILVIAILGSTTTVASVAATGDLNQMVEITTSVLGQTLQQTAIRGLSKYGVYNYTKTEEVVNEEAIVAAPTVVELKAEATKVEKEQYIKDNTYFKELGRIKDSHYKARKGANDSLLMIRNQFFNENGFVYVAGPIKSRMEAGETIGEDTKGGIQGGVKGVAHFMIFDDNGVDLTFKTSDAELEQASKDFKRNRIGKDIDSTDYVPVFKRDGYRIIVKYKLASEVEESDITITRLHQYKYGELNWQGKSDIGFSGAWGITTVDGKTVPNFVKTKAGPKAYSRFSGASAVFIFKDAKSNTIVRDVTGSIARLQTEANDIMKQFGVLPNNLTIGVYDAGSYTAKPLAKDGVLETNQYSGYNDIDPNSAGALIIPNTDPNPADGPNPVELGGGLTALLLALRKKKNSNKRITPNDIKKLKTAIKSIETEIANIKKEIVEATENSIKTEPVILSEEESKNKKIEVVKERLNDRYKDKERLKIDELNKLSDELGLESVTIEELAELYYSDDNAQTVINDFFERKRENAKARKASKDETSPNKQTVNAETSDVQPTDPNTNDENGHIIITHDKEFNEDADKPKLKSIKNPGDHKFFDEDHRTGNEVLNDKNYELEGEYVYYELDMQNNYNQSFAHEGQHIIEAVYYKDGNPENKTKENRVILGKVRGNHKLQNTPHLKSLRTMIMRDYKAAGSPEGIFASNYKNKIKQKMGGVIHTINQDSNPINVLDNEGGEKLVFGVAVEEGVGNVTLKVPNAANFGDVYTEIMLDPRYQLSNGNAFLIVFNNKGQAVPIHLNTGKFKDAEQSVKDEVNELIDSLTESNVKEVSNKISNHVYTNITSYNKATGKVTIQTKVYDKDTDSYNNVGKSISLEEYRNKLDNSTRQIDVTKINKGTYNEDISNNGVVTTDVNPITHFHSGGIEVSPLIEEVSSKQSSTETKPNNQSGLDKINEAEQEELSENSNIVLGKAVSNASSEGTFKSQTAEKIREIAVKYLSSISKKIEGYFKGEKIEGINSASDLIMLFGANPILKFLGNNTINSIRTFLENKEKGIETRTIEEVFLNKKTNEEIKAKYQAKRDALNNSTNTESELDKIKTLPFKERIPALIKMGIISSTTTYNLGKRFPIIVNIAGVKVAFYRSSEGTGGKEKGKWTPMFGFGVSKGNSWLIKGDINTLNKNYNSEAIKEYADILNSTLNWNHELDKGTVKNHPFFNVLELAKNEQAFNKELYNVEDLDIVNYKSDVSGYINNKLQEINAKYQAQRDALKSKPSTENTSIETVNKATGKVTIQTKVYDKDTDISSKQSSTETKPNNQSELDKINADEKEALDIDNKLVYETGKDREGKNYKGGWIQHQEETIAKYQAKRDALKSKDTTTENISTNESSESKPLVSKKPAPVTTAATKETLSPTSSKEDTLKQLDEIKKNKDNIQLENNDPNADFYVNKITGQKYRRVTSTFKNKPSKDALTPEGVLKTSAKIGTALDRITRDFFDGKLESHDVYKTHESYEEYSDFIKELIKLSVNFSNKGETVVTDEILLYNDELGIAGTVDLLTVDNDGNVRIYDLKAKRSGLANVDKTYKNGKVVPKGTDGILTGREEWQQQLSIYRILLNNTHGILAVDTVILPIQITKFDKKKTKEQNSVTRTSKFIHEQPITMLDKVENLKFGIGTIKLALDTNSEGGEDTGKDDDYLDDLSPSDESFVDPAFSKEYLEDKKWNKKKELDKLSKILPKDIAVKVTDDIEQIFGVDAWGVYFNAMIYLHSDNKQGVAYHEAFHAIYRSVLSPTQREALMEEAKVKYAAPLYSELNDYKEWYGDNALSVWYEEQMADGYAEYSVNQDAEALGIKGKIKEFFEKIAMWFGLIKDGHKSKINDLFYKIETGGFKHHQLYRKTSFTKPAFALKNMTATDKAEAIEHFKFIFTDILTSIREKQGYKDNVSDVDVINKEGGIHPFMQHVFTKMMRNRVSAAETAPRIAEDYKNIARNWVSGKPIKVKPRVKLETISGEFVFDYTPGQLYYDALKSLKDFGIVIKAEKVEEAIAAKSKDFEKVVSRVEDEEITNYQSWEISANQVSSKERLSPKIKRKFANIPKTNFEGVPKTDKFGYPVFEDFNVVYRYLEQNISDIYNPITMMNKLYSLRNSKPYINTIINLIEGDQQLKSEVYTSIVAKQFNHYLYIRQDKNGTKLFGSNRLGIRNVIINDLKNAFEYSKLTKEGKVDKVVAKQFQDKFNLLATEFNKRENYDKIKDENGTSTFVFNEKLVTKMYDLLNEYSIDVKLDQLKGLSKLGTVKFKDFLGLTQNTKGVKSLIALLVAGKNPLSTVDLESTEGSTLESIAKSLVPVSQNLFESSFINVGGKSTYAHNPSNFLHKKIYEFLDPKIRQSYLDTAFYKKSFLLKELGNDIEVAENFMAGILDGYRALGKNKGVAYDEMNKEQLETTVINAYHNNGNRKFAYYRFPVLSDSPQLPLIKFKKYSSDEVIDNMYTTVLQEVASMAAIKNSKTVSNIKNVKERMNKFYLVPFMDDYKGKITDVAETKAFIKAEMKKGFELELKRLVKLGIVETSSITKLSGDKKIIYKNTEKELLPTTAAKQGDLKPLLAEYYYNSKMMNTQMISLFSGDLKFYKNSADWQKRNKQVWSPKQYLDTSVTNKTYATIYLKDKFKPSEKEFTDFVSKTLTDKGFPKAYINSVVALYNGNKSNNETDAQAYITLERYKEIWEGLGRWTNKHEQAYNKAKVGKPLNQNEHGLFSIIKPFQFTHTTVDGIIVPVQNKNSEFVLLPEFINMDKTGKLKEIHDTLQNIQREKGITASAQFESAVKVGLYGQSDNAGDATVHELSNSDFGLQVETPSHYLDFDVRFGTQIRKLMLADTNPNEIFNVKNIPEISEIFGKEEVSFAELANKYQEIIGVNLKEGANEAQLITKDNTRISDYLTEAAEDRDLGQNLVDAIQLNSDGNFTLDLSHPLHSKRNEQLLNALYKNKVTKQKISGGQFINVSSLGFSDDLKIITKGDDFLHMEAYMPWWSKEKFEGILDDDGYVDVNKITDKRVLDVLIHRIPTEDKYSIFKLKIKGFTPPGSGGAVILPREATTIAGLDFDVDKMFGMMFALKNVDGQPTVVNPSIDTEGGRDNMLLSIMLGILSHSATSSSTFQPGGFDNLKNTSLNVRMYRVGLEPTNYIGETLKDTIEIKEEALNSIDMDLTEPSVQTELFTRNMTGKNLIGIFANHNVNHAMAQFTDLSVVEGLAPIFDGKKATALNSIIAQNGYNNTSRAGASKLAAVVDNAKDPIADFLNINTFTADTVALLGRLGHDPETYLLWTTQPVLVELTEEIFSTGAAFGEEDNVLNRRIAKKINQIKSILNQDFKPSLQPYTKESLIKMHKTNFLYQKDKDVLSQKQLIEKYSTFFLEQLDVLYSFKNNKSVADDLAKLVRGTRPDAVGAGPTMSQNETAIRNKESLDSINKLVNHEDFYTGDNLSLINDFYKYGIQQANDDLSRLFPWNNAQFMHIKDRIEGNKIKGNLSVDEIEFVNYSIYSYIASSKEYLTESNKNIDLLTKFHTRLSDFKNNNPNNRYVETFLNRFQIVPYNKDKGFKQIRFYNTGMSAIEKQNLTSIWEQMFNDKNPEIKKIAHDLAKYSFMSSAFTFTPYGFNNMLPVSYYTSLMDENGEMFNDWFRDKVNNTELATMDPEFYENFYTQFIQNNFTQQNFVKTINIYKTNKNVDSLIFGKGVGVVTIGKKNKKTWVNNDGNMPKFIRHKGEVKDILFTLTSSNDKGEYIYSQAKTLGMTGLLLEYSPERYSLQSLNSDNKIGVDYNEQSWYEANLADEVSVADVVQDETTIINDKSNLLNKNISYYTGDIKPDKNTVFVFGSNPEGRHGKGAAKIAKDSFGAKYGQGEGLQGNAYALPTKDLRIKKNKGFKSISPEQIVENIQKMYDSAINNPGKTFKVAYRNTTQLSLNGYTGLEMIDLFNEAGNIPSNVMFSEEWINTGKLTKENKPNEQLDLFDDNITKEDKAKSLLSGLTDTSNEEAKKKKDEC